MANPTATVLTWGCSHNQKDSQLIERQLQLGGYELISNDDMNTADVVVVNTCTVKTPTEMKIFHVLDTLKETKQKVVVAGCISQSEPELIAEKYPNFIKLGVNAAGYILTALGHKSNNGHILPMIESSQLGFKNNKSDWIEKPLLESTSWNPRLNIIQINEGCVNSCTFCATKFARGHLRSYSADSILHSIRREMTPEVWLTSQDTGCWGFDLKSNLSHLLNEISKIDRKFWVRVGMGNPNNVIKILDELVEAYKSDKIYKFLHLPVQAGSNDVLNHMKRGYTVEEYELIVTRFREEFPEISISTDVICGYPTESEEEFDETVRVIKSTHPDITNISRYWERRGTPAAQLDQLPVEERKRRSGILTKLCNNLQLKDNKKWIGWEGEALFNEEGVKGGIQARNLAYKPIIIHDQVDLGSWERVKVTEAKSTYLLGVLIE